MLQIVKGKSPRQALGTVVKASRVLDYVINFENSEGVSAAEVASALYFDRTTVHRLLKTLSHVGLIHQTPDVRYVPGPVLLGYGLALSRRMGWVHVVRPVLEWLVSETGETATFSLLLPNRMRMFADQVESPQTVRWVATVGVPMPLYAGASSKVILSAMSKDDVDQYLAEVRLEPITSGTITDLKELRAQLDQIRKQGYATSRGERSPGSGAVAAAVVTKSAGAVGAISICGPIARMTPAVFPRYGDLVKETARRVSEMLEPRS